MHKNISLLRCLALLACCAACPLAGAIGLQPLGDAALAEVAGRDGVSLAVSLNQNIGSVQYKTLDTLGNAATLAENGYSLTGTYFSTFDVRQGPDPTLATSYLDWAIPNLGSAPLMQLGYDFAITAGGSILGSPVVTLGHGVTFQNLAIGGSSMQMGAASGDGISFGVAVNASVGHVLLQHIRGNTTGQMDFQGVTVNGGAPGVPWVLADLLNQKGTFHVSPTGGGEINLQIDWPDPAPLTPGAPSGSLQINNVTITTPLGGAVNLGSSSIGSMQIQYLNVKFKS